MKITKLIVIIILSFYMVGCKKPEPFNCGEKFFYAFMDYQKAEKMEKEGLKSEALKKFKDVLNQLHEIEEHDPNWKRLIMEYRLEKTRDSIERLSYPQQNI